MKNYLRWSFRQLHLIFFWPTQFGRELEGNSPGGFKQNTVKTIRYLLGMLPWIIVLAVLGNIVGGYICGLLGRQFNWRTSWIAMLYGISTGVVLGPVGSEARVLAQTAGLGAASLWIGIAVGAVFFALIGRARAISVIVASGVGFGVYYGIYSGMFEFMTESDFNLAKWIAIIGSGTTVGVSLGLGFGGAFSKAFGIRLCAVSSGVVSVGFLVVFGWKGAVWALWAFLFFGLFMSLGVFRLGTYPLDFMLSITTYLVGRLWPRKVARAWRCCPVAWNELIWLPLPLAGKLLAMLVKQDREKGFRQIAFVAAERKLQGHVVLVALIEVALNDSQANTMAEMANVTNKISWTREPLSIELPAKLAGIMAVLDKVSQHAGQYLTLQNSYRRVEVLRRAVDEIQSIQFRLIEEGGPSSQRILRMVNQWRALLEIDRANLMRLTDEAREIPNPFVFGNPVMETEHNIFSGRKDIAKQIEASVFGTRQAPTLLLHGPRRIGKTSILCQLPRLLGSDFAPAVVDCQNPAVVESEVMLLRYLSRALSESLRQRRVHVESLTAGALAREPFSALDEWLDTVESKMPGRMRALLCLDEYERLQDTLGAEWGGKFLDVLRHTIQHRPRIVLMFTGTHTFQELGPEWTGRFLNARRVRVSFLHRDEVELLLRSPIPKFNMTYTPGALDAVIAATNCQPFLTQAVAFELVQFLNQQQRKEATPDDVEIAVARALVSGGEYFANIWYDSGEQGQAILRAIAKGETPPAFHIASAWLRAQDVLNDNGDFAVEMMRRWVKTKSF